MERRLYGGEIEKTISNKKTGEMHAVTQQFFERLAEQAWERGREPSYHQSDTDKARIIGVKTEDLGEQGLDNGFNLQETSLPPANSLAELAQLMKLDLETVQRALHEEGATVTNLSIHPLGKRDMETYRAFVVPKGIYPYLWYRGWDHSAGIDARAQNSPTTSVEPYEAATALSVILGGSAAFVGIFANSPFEEGRRSDYKEVRLTMWDRMMRNSKVAGDRETIKFPPFRFRTLAQYFQWMFGGETGIHFVIAQSNDKSGGYKGIGDRILIIEGNPPVLDYLTQPSWEAYFLRDLLNGNHDNRISVIPDISHMESMQFAQFTGGRIRYVLDKQDFPIDEFLRAMGQPDKQSVEAIFSQYATSMWIEGRDPGANFPDRELWEAGDDVAQSVIIAPSAIQAGLIRNLQEAEAFINRFNWQKLKALREAAIKDGLTGEVEGLTVYDFAQQVIEIAARGLTSKEQQFLRYPLWVLQTRENGADRAIRFVDEEMRHGKSSSLREAIKSLVISRGVIIK